MQIGASWSRKTQDGKKYLSCVIQLPFLGEINFALFPAKEKKSEMSPDYIIIWSQKKKGNAEKIEEQFSGKNSFDESDLAF